MKSLLLFVTLFLSIFSYAQEFSYPSYTGKQPCKTVKPKSEKSKQAPIQYFCEEDTTRYFLVPEETLYSKVIIDTKSAMDSAVADGWTIVKDSYTWNLDMKRTIADDDQNKASSFNFSFEVEPTGKNPLAAGYLEEQKVIDETMKGQVSDDPKEVKKIEEKVFQLRDQTNKLRVSIFINGSGISQTSKLEFKEISVPVDYKSPKKFFEMTGTKWESLADPDDPTTIESNMQNTVTYLVFGNVSDMKYNLFLYDLYYTEIKQSANKDWARLDNVVIRIEGGSKAAAEFIKGIDFKTIEALFHK